MGQRIVNIRSSVPGPRAPRLRLICTTDSSHLLMEGAAVESSERLVITLRFLREKHTAGEKLVRREREEEGKLLSNAIPPLLDRRRRRYWTDPSKKNEFYRLLNSSHAIKRWPPPPPLANINRRRGRSDLQKLSRREIKRRGQPSPSPSSHIAPTAPLHLLLACIA